MMGPRVPPPRRIMSPRPPPKSSAVTRGGRRGGGGASSECASASASCASSSAGGGPCGTGVSAASCADCASAVTLARPSRSSAAARSRATASSCAACIASSAAAACAVCAAAAPLGRAGAGAAAAAGAGAAGRWSTSPSPPPHSSSCARRRSSARVSRAACVLAPYCTRAIGRATGRISPSPPPKSSALARTARCGRGAALGAEGAVAKDPAAVVPVQTTCCATRGSAAARSPTKAGELFAAGRATRRCCDGMSPCKSALTRIMRSWSAAASERAVSDRAASDRSRPNCLKCAEAADTEANVPSASMTGPSGVDGGCSSTRGRQRPALPQIMAPPPLDARPPRHLRGHAVPLRLGRRRAALRPLAAAAAAARVRPDRAPAPQRRSPTPPSRARRPVVPARLRRGRRRRRRRTTRGGGARVRRGRQGLGGSSAVRSRRLRRSSTRAATSSACRRAGNASSAAGVRLHRRRGGGGVRRRLHLEPCAFRMPTADVVALAPRRRRPGILVSGAPKPVKDVMWEEEEAVILSRPDVCRRAPTCRRRGQSVGGGGVRREVRLVVLRHGRGRRAGLRRLLGGLDDCSGSGIVRTLLAAWEALCSGEAPGVLAADATARYAGEAVVAARAWAERGRRRRETSTTRDRRPWSAREELEACEGRGVNRPRRCPPPAIAAAVSRAPVAMSVQELRLAIHGGVHGALRCKPSRRTRVAEGCAS